MRVLIRPDWVGDSTMKRTRPPAPELVIAQLNREGAQQLVSSGAPSPLASAASAAFKAGRSSGSAPAARCNRLSIFYSSPCKPTASGASVPRAIHSSNSGFTDSPVAAAMASIKRRVSSSQPLSLRANTFQSARRAEGSPVANQWGSEPAGLPPQAEESP